jgi:hypothetical protein
LQDDLVKFISEPASPPQQVEVPEEGKAKVKERREVGEGDDIVVVEDTSEEDDDEETETNRISANETPTLSTSVVVPEGLPHANPISAMPKSIQKDKTE